MAAVTQVLAFIGSVVIGAGAVGAVAWWLFRTFADRWLQSKFDAQLEILRHKQAQEIEGVRFEFGKLADRAFKLHQQEFEKLPDLWEKLTEAYGRVYRLAVGFKQSPDLDRYTAEELDEFLKNKSSIPEYQKTQLRGAEQKTVLYAEISGQRELWEANAAVVDFHNSMLRWRIFLAPQVAAKFSEIDRSLRIVMLEQTRAGGKWNGAESPNSMRMASDGDAIIDELEALVRGRLWEQTVAGGAS